MRGEREREEDVACLYSRRETELRRKEGQVREERSPLKVARVEMKDLSESF